MTLLKWITTPSSPTPYQFTIRNHLPVSFNSVSTVTRTGAGWAGVDSRQGQVCFSSPPRQDRLWGPSILYPMATGDFPRG